MYILKYCHIFCSYFYPVVGQKLYFKILPYILFIFLSSGWSKIKKNKVTIFEFELPLLPKQNPISN